MNFILLHFQPFLVRFLRWKLSLKSLNQGYVSCIGCFVCTSVNGSDPACEDPHLSRNFQDPCLTNLKGRWYDQIYTQMIKVNSCVFVLRSGMYPASSCLKISGSYGNYLHRAGPREKFAQKYFSDTGEMVTVRTCAVDGGSLTADTEIVRLSHCGLFYLDDRCREWK